MPKKKSKPKDPALVPTQVVINPPIPKPGPGSEDSLYETVQKIITRKSRGA
jgi:hypothetical protein